MNGSTLYGAGVSSGYAFKLGISNTASTNQRNGIRATNFPDVNFAVTFVLSNVNVSAGQTNNLGIPNINVTYTNITQLSLPLPASASIDVDGHIALLIPVGSCWSAHFLCAHVQEGVGAKYHDSVTTNNYHCVDLDIIKRCYPGVCIFFTTHFPL